MLKRIDAKYVHKANERNVLLADVWPREGQDGWYDAEMVADLDHPFFFEHPLDHIPAMMMVEAGRQLGIAVCHLFLAVPFGRIFASRSLEIRFSDFAEKGKTVYISGLISDRQLRRGELIQARMDGYFSQENRTLGHMGGTWCILKPELWKRYRRFDQWKKDAG